MAENALDYPAMLADMKVKKGILDQAIASLEAAIAAGALGVTTGDVMTMQSAAVVNLVPGSSGGDIPKGAFFGKTIAEAILAYIAAVRKKCTTLEIAQGLKKGGIETTSKTFNIVVRNTLHQLKSKGKTLLFDDGWALAEWYPEGLRTRVGQMTKVQGKKHKPKKKVKAVKSEKSEKADKTVDQNASKPLAIVEKYYSSNPAAELSAKELATAVGAVPGLNFVVSQLVRKGWLEKTPGGKFRRSTKVTSMSKTA